MDSNRRGPSEDYIVKPSIRNRRLRWLTEVSGQARAISSPRPTPGETFDVDPDRPSPSPLTPPTVSSVVAVIAAPSRAGAAVESAPGSQRTADAGLPPPPGQERSGLGSDATQPSSSPDRVGRSLGGWHRCHQLPRLGQDRRSREAHMRLMAPRRSHGTTVCERSSTGQVAQTFENGVFGNGCFRKQMHRGTHLGVYHAILRV